MALSNPPKKMDISVDYVQRYFTFNIAMACYYRLNNDLGDSDFEERLTDAVVRRLWNSDLKYRPEYEGFFPGMGPIRPALAWSTDYVFHLSSAPEFDLEDQGLWENAVEILRISAPFADKEVEEGFLDWLGRLATYLELFYGEAKIEEIHAVAIDHAAHPLEDWLSEGQRAWQGVQDYVGSSSLPFRKIVLVPTFAAVAAVPGSYLAGPVLYLALRSSVEATMRGLLPLIIKGMIRPHIAAYIPEIPAQIKGHEFMEQRLQSMGFWSYSPELTWAKVFEACLVQAMSEGALRLLGEDEVNDTEVGIDSIPAVRELELYHPIADMLASEDLFDGSLEDAISELIERVSTC